MKKYYRTIANEILEKVGGETNVSNVTHCATRLRFNLKEALKANEESIKKVKGVVGIINKGGQFQVIIGNDVNRVYNELLKIGNFKKESSLNNDEKKVS